MDLTYLSGTGSLSFILKVIKFLNVAYLSQYGHQGQELQAYGLNELQLRFESGSL